MGNWRSVQIEGTCAAEEVSALQAALSPGRDLQNFHCLCGGLGFLGLPLWAAEHISAAGNLAERDFTVEDVATQLDRLAKVAPSLTVKIHCGGEWEDTTCVATVTLENGAVTIGQPEVAAVRAISEEEMQRNFLSMMNRYGAS